MEKCDILYHFFFENDPIFSEFNNAISERDEDLIKNVLNTNIEDFLYAIRVREYPIIGSKDVPMFSEFTDSTEKLLYVLDSFDDNGIDFTSIGQYLRETNTAKENAYYKYGETHSKLASMMGLVSIQKVQSKQKVRISNFGEFFLENPEYRNRIITRSILKLKTVQYLLKKAYNNRINCYDLFSFLSKNTLIRRTQDIKRIITILEESEEYDFRPITKNIEYINKEKKDANV